MQSGSALFLVAVLELVVAINYIFILFIILGGILHPTSHAAILNPLAQCVSVLVFQGTCKSAGFSVLVDRQEKTNVPTQS